MPIKVALIHDWMVTHRGGEKVFEAIAELFPEADVFTLFHEPGVMSPTIDSRKITTSWLNDIPGARKVHRYFLPLMPLAIESFDLSGYDLVISSSHCVAKGVIPPPQAPHITYCHTPMRYAWDKRGNYFKSFFQKIFARPILPFLRMWDVTSSHRVDSFVANSHWVAARIDKYYRRESTVITPFVDEFYFKGTQAPREDFYLVVSSFAPYKRIDLAIAAAKKLGRQLVVVGDGQESSLKSHASDQVKFVGRVSDAELRGLYERARALIFPGEEDFGIVPLEAMACGCPVIAYGKGGLTETVIENSTGLFFHEQSEASLVEAILRFEMGTTINSTSCRARAARFTKDRFQEAFKHEVQAVLTKKESRWGRHLFEGPSAPISN